MALVKFSINGVDFTDCIKRGSLLWSRYDLEKDGSGRSLDTYMHRHRLGQKRKLKMECRRLTDTRARQLALALDPETVTVTYNDMKLGITTKTFYGTELNGGIWGVLNNVLYWDGIDFDLTEV
ncbi:MAG: hypothetical protein Q4E45_02205 [Eubacteriales bacterium]|nr:hypothetical protein [Eubacteriales bacterium]